MFKKIILKKGNRKINVGTTRLEDGTYKGILCEVSIRNNRTDSRKINFIFKFKLKCGNELVNYDQPFVCVDGMPSQRLIDFLNMFYEDIYSTNEEIDLSELEETYVQVELQNQDVNGKSYCNIVRAIILNEDEYKSNDNFEFD